MSIGTFPLLAAALTPTGGVLRLSTTVNTSKMTVGDNGGTPKTYMAYYAYGADDGADYYGVSEGGSIATNTYTDGGGNIRTITWLSTGGENNYALMSIDGINVPNNDDTFSRIIMDVGGTFERTYFRANATYFGNINGASHWRWLDQGPLDQVHPDPANPFELYSA